MLEVDEMSNQQIADILERVNYGHLACCKGDRPYVVPIHFAYHDPDIYIYTTEGKKSAILEENPQVCLQAEIIIDNEHWQSVIVDGVAERITEPAERERAVKLITEKNPTLTPAISIHWMDQWVRENIEAIFRIKPTITSGRESMDK